MLNKKITITFNKPYFSGNELQYIEEAISGGHISGDGVFTSKCSNLLRDKLGSKDVLLTTSCTHALEMAALLLDIKSGDEVIFPSFTFVSTVNAFVLHGAVPVFADIRPDTLNINEEMIKELVTERTRCIVPVHYAGVGCEMDSIMKTAGDYQLEVVEDNALSLFARYKGKYLGTFAPLATQSFHETKNIICGEGGALIINDEKYLERAEIIREKGTDRSKFFRGKVDKYTWVDIGSSFLPSDILAAYLYAQLEEEKRILAKGRIIFESYNNGLGDLQRDGLLSLPYIPDYCDSNYPGFYILLKDVSVRNMLMAYLEEKGILAVFHYLPLHDSKMGHKFGYKQGDLPVTEDVSSRILRVPFYYDMEQKDIEYVCNEIHSFFKL